MIKMGEDYFIPDSGGVFWDLYYYYYYYQGSSSNILVADLKSDPGTQIATPGPREIYHHFREEEERGGEICGAGVSFLHDILALLYYVYFIAMALQAIKL